VTEPASLNRFAQTWSKALYGTGYVPLTPAERQQLLAGLAARLHTALTGEPFDPAAGWRVGADLAAGFAAPEVLGRTITVMIGRLAGDLQLSPVAAGRLPDLAAAVASGFSAAVHDRALDAQEAVRSAAVIAQARAQQALRDSEARIRHLATHDPVTGLPNRSWFLQRLAALADEAGAAPRVGVCCIGLDRFGPVNDSLGFQAGDRLLTAAADRLRALATPRGWQVVRLESDQFALLAETRNAEDAVKAADLALVTLAEPYQLDGAELPLTASAGVVERPVATAEPVDLLRDAQIALRWAKADGRGRWRVFCEQRAAEDAERYRLAAAIPAGLRQDEFILHYQPLVNLADGRIVGVEALARWRHPTGGLLPAGRFIGLAEQSGQIVQVGRRLLEQACRQAAFWNQLVTATPRYVGVNLSTAQLHQPGLAGHIAQTLDRTGLPPHLLQVEITERAAGTAETTATLTALAKLGVRVAVDDFGTGYSNLARLRDLPLTGLKLDATFARPVPATVRHDRFLANVTDLGHTLGLTVTAKGIETAAHASRMRAAGCDTGQGWHLGPPQPAPQITTLLSRY
jgi:diguanylate cyclase (GGDEF)-like protein